MIRLSEAILLGDSLKKCDPSLWLASDGSCGCALGGALLASGADAAKFYKENLVSEFLDTPTVKALWPWLTYRDISIISEAYFRVRRGSCTIEQLADYIRSIEPSDPEPPTPVDEMEAMYQKEKVA